MGKKKNKIAAVSVPDLFGKGITNVYLLVMFGLFPVFYPGSLIGIHTVKKEFFTISAGVYLCLMLIPFLCKARFVFKGKERKKIDRSDIFAGLFLIAALVSTGIALNQTEAVYGNSTVQTGLIVMLLCIGSYFFVKNFAVWDKGLIWANLLASSFIYLCGIFIACRTDILNMQKDIIDAQKAMFVSPLGNINFNVAYISLVLPAAAVMFLLCKEVFTKRVLAAYLFVGFMDLFCLRVDSAIVMILVVFLFLIYFSFEQETWFLRCLSVIGLFFAANIAVFILSVLLKDHMYPFNSLGALFVRTETVVLEFIFLCIFFVMQKKGNFTKERLWKGQKMYKITMFVLLGLFVVFVLALNFAFSERVEGTLLSNLVLNDAMGSGRGYVWIRTGGRFLDLPFLNQLFGCGLGCFYDFINPWYDDMVAKFGAVFYDPHNDFLQVLVTTGIVGVVGFFGMILHTMAAALKKRKNQEMFLAVFILLAAYLAQGLINSYTIFSTPILFILLGLANSSMGNTD